MEKEDDQNEGELVSLFKGSGRRIEDVFPDLQQVVFEKKHPDGTPLKVKGIAVTLIVDEDDGWGDSLQMKTYGEVTRGNLALLMAVLVKRLNNWPSKRIRKKQ